MNLYKYFPVPSDRMGILWTLSSIKDICIIEFGPAGTTHYAVEGIGQLNGEHNANIYSTHMNESDVTFGAYDRLEKSILEIDFNIKPKYIFVMASSVSSIIGTDVKGICRELQKKVNSKLIPIAVGGLKDDYNVGVEEALYIICKEIIKESSEKYNTFNIIGSTMDAFNFESDSEEIIRIMKELFSKEVQTVFTSNTSVEHIEKAANASLNIVLRKEGIKAAEYMKEKFNIPYVYSKPIGLNKTLEFLKEISETTSWEIHEHKLKSEISRIKKHMFSLSFKIRSLKNKDVAIFGDEDTVVSMKRFMEELNLNVHRAQIIHSSKSNYEDITIDAGEIKRMDYLREKELFMVLGDGVTVGMDNKCKKAIQISNPNMDKVNIYPYTPFVGLRGCLYLIEKII